MRLYPILSFKGCILQRSSSKAHLNLLVCFAGTLCKTHPVSIKKRKSQKSLNWNKWIIFFAFICRYSNRTVPPPFMLVFLQLFWFHLSSYIEQDKNTHTITTTILSSKINININNKFVYYLEPCLCICWSVKHGIQHLKKTKFMKELIRGASYRRVHAKHTRYLLIGMFCRYSLKDASCINKEKNIPENVELK